MAAIPLEERIAHLEEEVAHLKRRLGLLPTSQKWWDQITGTFSDDAAFEEAMLLGYKYRTAQRPRRVRRRKG